MQIVVKKNKVIMHELIIDFFYRKTKMLKIVKFISRLSALQKPLVYFEMGLDF